MGLVRRLDEPLEVAEVAPDVWRLRIPLDFTDPDEISLYLLRSRGGDVLVDAGMPGSEAALDAALARAGSGRDRLSRVVVTHEHIDHLGLAGVLGVPVAMHALTERILERFRSRDEGIRGGLLDRFWMEADDFPDVSAFEGYARFFTRPAEVEVLEEGDELPGGWRVLWTPGHAAGHLCLYREEDGVLVAGDHVLPGYTPHVGMDPFTEDPVGAYLRSLGRVRDFAVRLVLPSHGEPYTDLRGVVDGLIAHHERRLGQVEACLDEPRRVKDVAAAIFRKQATSLDAMMASVEAAAHLVHLEARGSVRRVPGRRWTLASPTDPPDVPRRRGSG